MGTRPESASNCPETAHFPGASGPKVGKSDPGPTILPPPPKSNYGTPPGGHRVGSFPLSFPVLHTFASCRAQSCFPEMFLCQNVVATAAEDSNQRRCKPIAGISHRRSRCALETGSSSLQLAKSCCPLALWGEPTVFHTWFQGYTTKSDVKD